MKATLTQYAKTLFELTEGKAEQEVCVIVEKFAQQLQKDGQMKNANKILEKFSEIYNAANQIVEAKVVSARKLENAQLAEIKKFVKEKYAAKEVEIENVVDGEIKGGIIIKIKDEVIDGSVASQLKKLQKQLIS